MAEIHVQAKKQSTSSTWVWIVLALLIIGAIVYYLLNRNNETNQAIPSSRPDAASQVTPTSKPPKPERLQTAIPVVYMRSV